MVIGAFTSATSRFGMMPVFWIEAPEGFDAKKDFQLARAEDVLKYGSVAATPKLAAPTARLAGILSKSKVAEVKVPAPKP